MSDDVIGNVKEAFSGKRGKILLIGGGACVAAYVIYTRYNGTPEELSDDDLLPVPGGRTPQTDPEVGNDGSSKPGRPTTNAAWLSDGVDYLVGRGTPASTAHDALNRALSGLTLSSQQVALVSQVITALGSPPEGMPPLNASAPPSTDPPPIGTNPPTTPKPKPPPPISLPKPKPPPPKSSTPTYIKVTVARSPAWKSTISGIAGHYGKSWSTVWNDSKNASLRKKRGSPNKIQPGDAVYVKK